MGDAAAQLNHGMSYGLMNAFRTGNMVIDVLICMLVPMVVKSLFGSNLPVMIQRWISDLIKGTRNEYVRTISYENKTGGGYYYGHNDDLDSMERNNLLQKAIRLYLSEKSEYTTNTGDVFLIPKKKIKLEKDRWGDECRFSGSYQQLMSYEVTYLPADGIWVEIVGEGVWFRQTDDKSEESNGSESKTTVRTVTFEIKAHGSMGEKMVTAWISKVFDWYRALKAEEQDMSRYFLQAQTKREGDKEFSYKKYQLSEHKTFDTLFFPEKSALLRIVDDFLLKRGKFGIPGFPHKLGLLLDGPPGTGKTSLIKAIAQYTKRHIVTVSLDRISTNQELMDMMFDNRFNVLGGDEPMVSKMDEIVFVMEDVDAASTVVYAREGSKQVTIVPEDNLTEDNTTSSASSTEIISDVISDSNNLGVPEPTRTASAPAWNHSQSSSYATRVRSDSIGSALISKETKAGILREMASWEPEGERKPELPYKAQIEQFFKNAEVPIGPHLDAITDWCLEQGAVSFMECLENMKVLCKSIKTLKPLQVARLQTLARTCLGKKPSDDDDDEDDNGGGDDNDDNEGQMAALQSAMWQQFMSADFMNDDGVCTSGSGTKDSGSASGDGAISWGLGPSMKSSYYANKDKLNLAGLLNVLDGVVDTPGRILVMTTNHPEKLDPALIRPGRINKRLHLGYCKADTVADMAKHYLQKDSPMSNIELDKCSEVCDLQQVTPAWVEQCCAEVETYSELLRKLKRSL